MIDGEWVYGFMIGKEPYGFIADCMCVSDIESNEWDCVGVR